MCEYVCVRARSPPQLRERRERADTRSLRLRHRPSRFLPDWSCCVMTVDPTHADEHTTPLLCDVFCDPDSRVRRVSARVSVCRLPCVCQSTCLAAALRRYVAVRSVHVSRFPLPFALPGCRSRDSVDGEARFVPIRRPGVLFTFTPHTSLIWKLTVTVLEKKIRIDPPRSLGQRVT